ncbi:MAG: DUF2721 domain-containing protein [Maricaulaceae bacterium]|jgi:hypothetical protein
MDLAFAAAPIPEDIARTIQLAVAPVFLIAGIGALLNVLTSRLARVVDRGRALEADLEAGVQGDKRQREMGALAAIDARMKRINAAITLATLAELLICVVVVFLFTSQFLHLALSRLIAGLFIAAMTALIGALSFFLAEISIATRTLRVRAEFLDKKGSKRGRGSA